MLANQQRIMEPAMKWLRTVPRDDTRLYGAIISKQAEIRRSGRGTFSRAGRSTWLPSARIQITAESSLRREQYPIQIDERAKSHYRRLWTHCDKDLPPDAKGARIRTLNCAFCAACIEPTLLNVCPNSGGGFSPRPTLLPVHATNL